MYKFSTRSKERLATCDRRIVEVMTEVIKHYDCTILEGLRDEETQNEYFRAGKSQVQYPDSKHNSKPSRAVDVAPYPIDWKDTERFRLFAGIVIGIAKAKGINLRWGGDWDGDLTNKDQSFHDLPHFELVD